MKLKEYVHVIKAVSIFESIPSNDLINILNRFEYNISQYKKGSIIHFESEICSSWDIIIIGKVIIQKLDENGDVLTVTEFNTGENMGGNLLFSNHPRYPMSVIAKQDTTILKLSKKTVLNLCQSYEQFLLEFLKCISDKTTILTSKIKSISLKTLRQSIIGFLRYEYLSQKNTTIKLKLSKKELAERLGCQRTSLSRELNKMKKDGLIDYDSKSIVIKDFNIIHN